MFRRLLALGLIVAGASLPAWGDEPGKEVTKENNIDLSQVITAMGGGGMMPQTGDAPFPEFKEVTKDMTSSAGLFTLWYYPAQAKDKDMEKLLCQIPSGFLGEKFMLSTSFSGGGFFTGFPIDERVVKWEILDKQLLLVEPESRFVAEESHPVSDVVKASVKVAETSSRYGPSVHRSVGRVKVYGSV